MPTTGAIEGNKILLKTAATGGTVVALGCLRDLSWSGSRATIDTTCKDNDGAEDFIVGGESATISAGGITAYDATNGCDEMLAAWKAGTVLDFEMATETTGDTLLSGSAIIESIDYNGNYNDVSQWSMSLKVKGGTTIGTVS